MTTKKKSHWGGGSVSNLQATLYTPSLSEAISDFQNCIYSNLATRPDIKPDGELHRFRLANERKGKLSGAYIFYTSPVYSGWWQSWVTGESGTWTFKSQKELSYAEKKALKEQIERNKAKRKAEQAKQWADAEKRALSIWSRSRPASTDHPYAVTKQMGVAGMRQLRDALVIPLYQNGKITSLQFINGKGGKRLLTGGRVKGSCFIFGDIRKPFEVAYIAEGISTGYSVHVLADYAPVLCAISAGNLEPVAVAVRRKFPGLKKLVIAADNDIKTDGSNVGVEYATRAAKACQGEIAIPSLPTGEKCDWCDLRLLSMGVKHER